jgi:hypothetical protein
MRTVLQIRTRARDELAERVGAVAVEEDCRWESVDISQGPQDYDALLDLVFRADAIQVW